MELARAAEEGRKKNHVAADEEQQQKRSRRFRGGAHRVWVPGSVALAATRGSRRRSSLASGEKFAVAAELRG